MSYRFLSFMQRTYNCREIWWGNTLVQDIIEVDVLKERVSLDFLRVRLAGPETSSRIPREELRKNI